MRHAPAAGRTPGCGARRGPAAPLLQAGARTYLPLPTVLLLKHNTQQTKAKAIRKFVDKMIGLAKDGSLHARRQALGFIYDPELVKSLFEQVGGPKAGTCRC